MARLDKATEQGFISSAQAAGMPLDQILNLYGRGYVPFLAQLPFHAAAREADRPDGPTKIGFGGARGPGKTTTTFAQVALDDCQRVAGLKCLFIRQTQKAARESFDDLRLRLLRHTPHGNNASTGVLSFPNGSRILLGGFANDKDIDKYLGLEYDLIAIEEDTQLSASKKQKLLTCLRTSKQNWRPRSYHTTNPGGVDHAGFKRTFITPFRKNQQTDTRFFPALATDNPALNPDYIKNLKSLTGWLRKAWLGGDWDIAAGQFFSTWRHDLHVCKPFEVSRHWPVWAAMDYGFTHPTVVYLFTEHDGMIYVIAEHWERKKLPPWHAEQIKAVLTHHSRILEELDDFVAGADAFAQRGDKEARTIADQYGEEGIILTPANTDRVNGWAEILQLLGDAEHGIEPRVKIFETCVRLIECIPALQHNPNKPEDVLKWDVDDDGNGGDDCSDAMRYGVMARRKYYSGAPLTGGRRAAA